MVRGEAMLHLDLDRRRSDVPDAFEERVEVRHVEVDHLAQGTGLVVEIDLEPQMGRPEAILERTGVVRPAVDEPEFREALQELRSGRDVNVEGPRDLARQMPVPVAQRTEDRDAVLAGEEQNRLSESKGPSRRTSSCRAPCAAKSILRGVGGS